MICHKIYWNSKILLKTKIKCYEKKWISCEKKKEKKKRGTLKPNATEPNPKPDVEYTKQQAIRSMVFGGKNKA